MAVAAITVIAEAGDDAGRTKAFGDRSRDIGQDRRERDREHRPRVAHASPEVAGGRRAGGLTTAPQAPTATKIMRGDHGRDRGAVGAEPEAEDQERIEPGRDDRRADSVTYMARLASPTARRMPEKAHAERHQEVRRQHDPQEAHGRPAASRRSRRGAQDRRQQRQEHERRPPRRRAPRARRRSRESRARLPDRRRRARATRARRRRSSARH